MLLSGAVPTTAPDDSVSVLNEIVVTASTPDLTARDKDGNLRLDTRAMRTAIRVGGEADMLTTLRNLPAVESNGDYGSGLSVDGTLPQHNFYGIEGAPVVFPYRFGGVFSTFNTWHFRSLTMERSARDIGMPSRLGASISLLPLYIRDGIRGTVNAGLLSSSATVSAGNEHFSATVSGRISYVDMLLKHLLKTGDNELAYDFKDANVSLQWRPTATDRLSANIFFSGDRLASFDHGIQIDINMKWTNRATGIRYVHEGPVGVTADIFHSLFRERMDISIPQMSLGTSSHMEMAGCAAEVAGQAGKVGLRGGIRGELAWGTPQWAHIEDDASSRDNGRHTYRAGEFRAHCAADIPAGAFTLTPGVSASLYRGRSAHDTFVCPRLNALWRHENNLARGEIGMSTQYLHCIGFSDIGLASNFWVPSSNLLPAEKSLDFLGEYSRTLPMGFTASASVYFRRLYNQAEYTGNVLDLLADGYDAMQHVTHGDGWSYGVSLSLRRDMGKLCGEVSYSWLDGRLHGSGGSGYRPITSAGNVLKVRLSWKPAEHWDVTASFRYSDGRPFTPIRELYVIGGNVAAVYGARNSSRLPSYQRLDLGATYSFYSGSVRQLTHLVNLSLLNAYGHRNIEMQYYRIDATTGSISLHKVCSVYRFLPSVSYTLCF